jgi:hypothetical protein
VDRPGLRDIRPFKHAPLLNLRPFSRS